MPRTRNNNCEINDNPTFLPCTLTASSSRNGVTVPYRVDVCSDHVRLLWPEQQVLAAERHHPRLGRTAGERRQTVRVQAAAGQDVAGPYSRLPDQVRSAGGGGDSCGNETCVQRHLCWHQYRCRHNK